MTYLLAIFCVALFSLTVPFTRLATMEAAPELVILLRLIIAGVVCLILVLRDGWIPPRRIWWRLFLTSFGAVVGFSSLMAYALHEVPGSHGAVALAALPAVTALYASLRDHSKPGIVFWLFAALGTVLSFGFFFTAVEKILFGDFLLALAVLSAAFGYVEGARLSRESSGRRIMSWAILLTLPVTLVTALILSQLTVFDLYAEQLGRLSWQAWSAIFYLALISQSIGMFLWYSVLARGPMERVALTQLLQPFFTLLSAIFILHESVSVSAWVIAALVALCVLGATRAKTKPSNLSILIGPRHRKLGFANSR